MTTLFKLSTLENTQLINFISTYDGWTPVQWEGSTVIKIPMNHVGLDGIPQQPIIDTFGVKGTISLDAYCNSEDISKVNNLRFTYAKFVDPYGTYRVYVSKANFNTKEHIDLEKVGLELIVVEVLV